MAIDAQPAGTTQPDPGLCTHHRVGVESLNSVFVRPLAGEACAGADPCPHRDLNLELRKCIGGPAKQLRILTWCSGTSSLCVPRSSRRRSTQGEFAGGW